MLLRTRITLMVSLSTVVVALVLVFEGRVREERAIERYDAAQVAGDRTAWFGVRESASERLNAYADDILHDEQITRAVADRDAAALAQTIAERAQRMKSAKVPVLTEIFAPTGELEYSSTGEKTAEIPVVMVSSAVRRSAQVRGLARLASQHVAVAVVSPIYSRAGVSGVLAVYAHIGSMVADIANLTDASIYLLGVDGRPLGETEEQASDPSWGPAVGLPLDVGQGVMNRTFRRQVFLTDWFTLEDALGLPAGRLVAVREVTADYRRAQLISLMSRGATLAAGALFLAFLYWYMRNEFRPLNAVIRVLNRLSHGDTAAPRVDAAGRNDEIGRLAGTLENFRAAQQARDQLARIRQDIDAASRIQQSILPRNFPVTARYRLHAIMRPAQNVGGDFYDFFDLPDGRLGFVVADVSGKGMGAAMFMAMARTVIRSVALVTDDPGECLSRANELLCTNNRDGGTFVTVFYGMLDPASGRVAYANGGHNPPYHLRAAGAVEAVPSTGGMALGVMEGMNYADGELFLGSGDHLFLYTDGVTEAMSPAGDQLTEERLERTLGDVADADAATVIAQVVEAVDRFAADAPQADDITCLAIEFDPRQQPPKPQ